MKRFIQRYGDKIEWILSGFDRLVFRGYLRGLSYPAGLMGFLGVRKIPLTAFGGFVQKTSERIKESSLREAQKRGRPVIYLPSSLTSKEATAQKIAQRDSIRQGLVCVLTCVEPCKSFEVYRDRKAKRLELQSRFRKCLFLYHYWMDPVFGFMSARIQTWFPFPIQVCLNGREWLARQMDRVGLGYEREDNCFVNLKDPVRAQQLMDRQVRFNWPWVLRCILHRLNPAHRDILGDSRCDYYWSVYQSEWATDLRFRDAAFLAHLYPSLVLHGITAFGSGDVMRFLGRKPHGNFEGEIRSDFKDRAEGIRIKHWVNRNSVKLYNKHPLILRAETTTNRAADLKVFRRAEGDPRGPRRWHPLRQGVADIHRRAHVSQQTNGRYLDALAAADTSTPLGQLIEGLCRPVLHRNRRIRGLRPWAPEDVNLFKAVSRGEFALNGFRNRDLQARLFPTPPATPEERRRRSGQVSRRLRMLRAHGLIRKMPRSQRYRLTPKGNEILAAVLAAQRVTLEQLKKAAA